MIDIPSMISFTVVYTKQNNFVVSRRKTVFLKLKNSDSMTTLKIIKFSLAVNSKKFRLPTKNLKMGGFSTKSHTPVSPSQISHSDDCSSPGPLNSFVGQVWS